ncbi:MAG: glycosyltransferase family 2 protein [Chitinophagaceae bacterium]|jgi:glycosyltransferase involved in cell wall biosynthesis
MYLGEQKSEPLVSIITIAYNSATNIEATIKSVLAQTYPHIEYIVIDGGSTDGTADIIGSYANQIKYWVSEKDRGISHAFNKGLAKASGEIIGLLNASDIYMPDTITIAVNALQDADIAYGDLRYEKKGDFIFTQKGDHRLLKKEMSVNHPTVFIKSKWYKEYGCFDEQLRCAMDYDLLLRFYLKGAAFVNTNKQMAVMSLDGMSDANWLLGCRETLRIKNKYIPQAKLMHQLYFIKHTSAISISRLLNRLGMGSLLKYYRSRFAALRKSYDLPK